MMEFIGRDAAIVVGLYCDAVEAVRRREHYGEFKGGINRQFTISVLLKSVTPTQRTVGLSYSLTGLHLPPE